MKPETYNLKHKKTHASCFMLHASWKKGFTLIEILVTIGILSIIMGLLTTSYNTAQMRGRDSKRKNDLNQLRQALELYRQDQPTPLFPTNGTFLQTKDSCWSSGLNCTGNVYMRKMPVDPDSSSATTISYSYTVNNPNFTYTLCACLENDRDPDGSTTNCSTMTYNARSCTSGKSYIVNPY